MTTSRARAGVLLALLTVLSIVATAFAGSASAADVRHHGPNWSWTGPSSWIASYGTYGIRVEGNNAHDVLDVGFSSTVCSPGATYAQSVSNYFAAKRAQYRKTPFRIGRASAIVHPAGTDTNYRRQYLRVGFRSGGIDFVGHFIFDYDYQTTVSTGQSTVNYCYQRSLAMYAPKTRYDASAHARLQRVFDSLAYSGPGACMGTNGSCDPDIG